MFRRILPRALAGTAVLALTVAATGACGGSGGGDTGSGKKPSSFSMQGCEPQHMIPGNSNELCGIQVLHYLFTGLVDFDAAGKPVNMMAQSITSTDQQHWTIKIKPGWKFHNGEPVTSQSYIDAWNYASYAPNGYVNSYFFANIKGYDKLNPTDTKAKPRTKTMSGLKKVDDTTFKVTLTAPFSQFPLTLGYTGFGPLPKVAFKDVKAFEQKPIGNGPYQMNGSWDHNKDIKLKRYAGYTGSNKGHVDNVDYRIYSQAQTAYNDLTAGNLDQAQIPPSRVTQAKAQFGDRFINVPTSQLSRIDFPMYDKRFQNVDLRHALSMAIDRQAISDKIFNGTVKPAKSWVSPVVDGARADACQGYCDFDPAKAKALLKKAGGWKGSMTLWYNPEGDNGVWIQAIANQWKRNLGITVKLKSQPFAQYLTSQSDHKMSGPFRNSWLQDYPSVQNYIEPIWTTGASANRTGYTNKAVDKFVKQGNEAKSVKAGLPFYFKAEDQIAKDMPGTVLWSNNTTQGYDEKIKNVKIDAFGLVRISDIQMA